MNVHATHPSPAHQVQQSSHHPRPQNDGPKVNNNDHPKAKDTGKSNKIVDKTA